jgi:hypothetical protein
MTIKNIGPWAPKFDAAKKKDFFREDLEMLKRNIPLRLKRLQLYHKFVFQDPQGQDKVTCGHQQ